MLDFSGEKLGALQQLQQKLSSKQFTALNLSGNGINEISVDDAKLFSQISYLDISNNNISNLDFLIEIPNLTTLIASNNNLTLFQYNGSNPKLQKIILSNNQIIQISFNNSLNSLLYLEANNNKIRNINFGNKVKSLQELYVDNNSIKNLNGVENLISLQKLSVKNNIIEDFPPIKLPSLIELDISGNKVMTMNPFTQFSNLQTLNISNNLIDDKSFNTDFCLNNLVNLNVSYSQITKPIQISKFAPNLQVADISNTNISDEKELIKFIENARSLALINFHKTPLMNDESSQLISKQIMTSAKSTFYDDNVEMTDVESIKAGLNNRKAIDELEMQNKALRNEIIELIYGENNENDDNYCVTDIISELKRENEFMKKLLFEKSASKIQRESEDRPITPKRDVDIQTSQRFVIQKEENLILPKRDADIQTSQRFIIQKEEKAILPKRDEDIQTSQRLLINQPQKDEKETQKDNSILLKYDKQQKSHSSSSEKPKHKKIDSDSDEDPYDGYKKRRDYLLRHFSGKSHQRFFESLQESNSDLIELLKYEKEKRSSDKSAIEYIEQLCEDNAAIVNHLVSREGHKHRHKHIHHHVIKVKKEQKPKNVMKHHHADFFGSESTDSEFDEREIDNEYRCAFCPPSPQNQQKEKEEIAKVEKLRRPKNIFKRQEIRLTYSLSRSNEAKLAELKLERINGCDIDSMRLPYWEDLSCFVDFTFPDESRKIIKPLKNCWPFTEREPRSIPWDYEYKTTPETRPNSGKIIETISMRKITEMIINNARLNTKFNEPINKDGKEADIIKLWIKGATGYDIKLDNIQRAPNSTKVINLGRNSPIKNLKLGLMKVKNGPVAMRRPSVDNMVINLQSITSGEYVMFVFYGGRIARDKHDKTVPSGVLMSVISKAGFDSIVFGKRGHLKICVCDGSKVVPIYSFSVL
ncbi:Leucine Rich Repeat family protein [Trichomonas vaginalis G3]|uniref:Leucine Rich Repeat family protein n=1 Tax=Trichomonas vaginalis (strain ATCC PRA-98 / G3) TaxID=412133 RepID=A2EG08_TRIV3|nr:uncharacterized protein TVAGG3_0842310 [Trichomonas vaginalis G3]EAY08369.1 Leucine Rich Repeat family protein [Trichomonas vaginalis G3]KAI5499351.1 axoneme assembly [Trichomonas vaginalis G3]|eukprot:XP_001320592.1 hypothetical protein [Trichomonas vaginalis G3]